MGEGQVVAPVASGAERRNPHIAQFGDPVGAAHDLVGGKGANLGLLTQAGFPVPPGFTVTTAAYESFLEESGVGHELGGLIDELAYDDAERLETQTARIRSEIAEAEISSEMRDEIEQAYQVLGTDEFVAVRSSGTAEDTAEASYAGLHDTYLDIRGTHGLLEAVRNCWASLWTARATGYRHANGVDHLSSPIAVVVQRMVAPDVAGVLFTANPLTTATDEMVVNANWGLGESVVGGTITPDEFTLNAETLGVIESKIGTKESKIVRAAAGQPGTVTIAVGAEQSEAPCLSESELRELGLLGRTVQSHYDGLPQDIEWALAEGRLYLLQSRPITGVAFSWDADVDAGNPFPDDCDYVWTRAWADAVNTGVVTPLTYSLRYRAFSHSWSNTAKLMALDDLVGLRAWKYWKGELYYNALWEKRYVEHTGWPAFRPYMLEYLPPAWHEEVLAAPFNRLTYLRAAARAQLLSPKHSLYGFLKSVERWKTERPEIDGLSEAELGDLSDHQLKGYVDRMSALDGEYAEDAVLPFFFTFRDVMLLAMSLVGSWYDGDATAIFMKLCTGATRQTETHRDNLELWQLSELIRNSEPLSELFRQHPDGDFFTACESTPDGERFLAAYGRWLERTGHRGQSDRDLYYTRRLEDPSLDYQALRLLLSGESENPEDRERQVNAIRDEALADVLQSMRRLPFGAARAELFKWIFGLMHDYFAVRDDQRARPNDTTMYSLKRGLNELGRRLVDRGDLDDAGEIWFLARDELFALFDGNVRNRTLLHTKITARRRDCERMLDREANLPKYLRGTRRIDLDVTSEDPGDGQLRGVPTSPGVVTGTARVVKALKDIGTVQAGDILVVNATDPGWGPVFLKIKGIVPETGGMLSHASCLAREYGFPAVQLAGAMTLIPDGATITVDGNAGLVTVDSDQSLL
jgi:pyruvate,water dikinase